MVPICCSGTLTNVLPHRNAMPQTQDKTPHPVTVYRHEADLSLCYPLIWNVILEYTATHFMSWVRPDQEILPRPSTHTSELPILTHLYIQPELGSGDRVIYTSILLVRLQVGYTPS